MGYNLDQKDTVSKEQIVGLSVRAAFAAKASWEKTPVGPRYIDDSVADTENDELQPGQAAERRQAIAYMYLYILGRPSEAEWAERHVVKSIMLALRIPTGSFGSVKDCLNILCYRFCVF